MVAAAVTAVPGLATFSRCKELVFAASGGMVAVNYWLLVVRPGDCRSDEACHPDTPMMRRSRGLFWLSVGIYLTALVTTYGSLLVLARS